MPGHHGNCWLQSDNKQCGILRSWGICSGIHVADQGDNVSAKYSSLPYARFPQSRLTAFGVLQDFISAVESFGVLERFIAAFKNALDSADGAIVSCFQFM